MDAIDAALFHLQNKILSKPSIDIRHRLLGVRMFDEFTTSNAEAEHSSLKSRGLGVNVHTSLTDLFLKTMKAAEIRSSDKQQNNVSDLQKTDTATYSNLSQHVTRNCYKQIIGRIQCSLKCISKQNDSMNWVVIYVRDYRETLNANAELHYLPLIKRKRYVHNDNGMLYCSCKTMERFGYPCHHLLHVIGCTKIDEIKLEWIHIRWFKKYIVEHCEVTTDKDTEASYRYLYDNHPNGLKDTTSNDMDVSFPVLRGPEGMNVTSILFDVPDFQFLCRKTGEFWHERNKSTNPELNAVLSRNDPNTIEREINLSQSQNIIFQNNDSEDEEDVISTDTNRDCFTIFKRAQSLSECDKTKQAELYNLLNNFVKRHEFDHNDNDKVFSNRKKDELTTISSNRIIHTNKRGPKLKRFKAAYERK